ncbi:MAG: hypothetical protein ACR2KG_13380 [Nocardioidaceae bacterium]
MADMADGPPLDAATAARARAGLQTWRCPHCDALAELQCGSAGRSVLEVWHEPGCPDHFDSDACMPTWPPGEVAEG